MRIWIPQFVVNWIIRKAQKTPYTNLVGYMNRWWFARFGPRDGGGESGAYTRYAARVHQILTSDKDEDYHNHPWPFITIILRGGYWELRPVFDDYTGDIIGETRTWKGPGSILIRSENDYHKVELPEGKDSWSLFIMGAYKHVWGYLVPRKRVHYDDLGTEFVPWREYQSRNTVVDMGANMS